MSGSGPPRSPAALLVLLSRLSLLAIVAIIAPACDSGGAGDGGASVPLPRSEFACGRTTCDARTSYCEAINTDVAALPATFTCRPLPEACRPRATAAGCDCFPPGTRCRDFCRSIRTDGISGLRLVCVGGG